MRAFFSTIAISSVMFLAPFAQANTLLPGPTGSAPTDKSFFLIFDRSGSADSRSYIVDRKGFYERDGWSMSGSGRIGLFNDDQGSRRKGFSSNIAFNGFNSRGSSGGVGGGLSGGAGFSSGGANGGGGSVSGGSGFFNIKGLQQGLGAAGGNGGSSLSNMMANAGSNGSFGFGSEGQGTRGGDPPGDSATPLPASWTMMLIGLAFGLLAWIRNRNPSKGTIAYTPIAQ